MAKSKICQANVFLIKEEFTEFSSVIRDNIESNSFSLKEELKIDAIIYIGKQSTNLPSWVNFLKQGSKNSIPELSNTSNRAVMLVREKGRMFAFVFGYGRYMIKDEAYINDFGFRVAINAVNPTQLKSLDLVNIEESTVQSRIQASISSSKESFGIDISRDLMRSVTGIPRNKKLAKVISGRDSVILNSSLDINDIRKKCRLLLFEYKSTKYREQFDWIDNLAEERDKSIISELQTNLIDDIKNNNIEKMHLAPPEPIDWHNINGVDYITRSQDEESYPTMDFYDYHDKITSMDDFSVETLKKHKVFFHFAESDKIISKWRIFDCLTYETDRIDPDSSKKLKYVFTLGRWYKIDTSFVQNVTKFVMDLPASEVSFIDCNVPHEGEYNSDLSKSQEGYYLMDKKNVKCKDARTVIEPCDILTDKLHFIHIKQKGSSANLSHLFSQGRISSEALIKDPVYVQNIKAIAKKEGMDLIFIPDNGKLEANECKIVFGIIDKSEKQLYESLPFFSLLNLRQSVEMLKLMGFQVFVNKINKTV